VAVTQIKSLDRVFPNRDLFRGKPLRSLAWGFIASLALCLLLVSLFLVADLLASGGRMDLSATEVTQFNELFPPRSADPESVEARPAVSPVTGLASLEGIGLGPTAWRLRRIPVLGPSLVKAYRRIGWLRDNEKCLMLLVLMGLAIACLRGFCLWRSESDSTRAALDVATRLRRTLHRQTLRLGPGDLMDPDGTRVVELFTRDVDEVRDGIRAWIFRLSSQPLHLVFLLVLALAVQWRVAMQCLILLGGCWYLVQRERLRYATAQKSEESRAEDRLRLLAEGLRKTRIVRGYGMEDVEHERFQRHLEKFGQSVAQVLNGQHVLRLAVGMLVLTCIAGVTFVVGVKVLQIDVPDGLSFSTALLMLAIVASLPRPLAGLWGLREQRLRAMQAADRIFQYLSQVPAVSQAVGAKFLEPLSQQIQFENVSYALPNQRKLLDGLDLKIKAGQVVAVASFDPLEPRALAYLLPRFIEPQSGRILFDAEDIAWGTLESLRAETVYVGGSDPFFTATVAENVICSSSGYTLPDATEAAKTAHAHSYILKLPQGYETVIGEHGEQLSAGQGFRLGLARAVLRDPALMIIEEPTEPLDDDTKSLLDDSYNRITRGRTVVFLPGRLSTLRRADSVIFLHHGKVESQGTYQDLVRSSSLFRHWEYMRFNQYRREIESVAASG
jgi:ABC-type multidrug transport system fused ATPase/permease subunit